MKDSISHTKGPWRAVQHDNYCLYVMAGVDIETAHIPTMVVAECTLTRDANLIASAPELLEALKAVYQEGPRMSTENWDKVCEAITKAEGR